MNEVRVGAQGLYVLDPVMRQLNGVPSSSKCKCHIKQKGAAFGAPSPYLWFGNTHVVSYDTGISACPGAFGSCGFTLTFAGFPAFWQSNAFSLYVKQLAAAGLTKWLPATGQSWVERRGASGSKEGGNLIKIEFILYPFHF